MNPITLDGCSVSAYTNSTGVTDSRNPSGARPYPDNLAFIAMTLKVQEKLNMVTLLFLPSSRGVKYGHRHTQREFSHVIPAWISARFFLQINPRYGPREYPSKIDDSTFQTCATYCDELIDGLPRFTLDLVVDTQKPAVDILTGNVDLLQELFNLQRQGLSLR